MKPKQTKNSEPSLKNKKTACPLTPHPREPHPHTPTPSATTMRAAAGSVAGRISPLVHTVAPRVYALAGIAAALLLALHKLLTSALPTVRWAGEGRGGGGGEGAGVERGRRPAQAARMQ